MPPPQPQFAIDQKVVRLFKEPYVEGDEFEVGKIVESFCDKNGGYSYSIAEGHPLSIQQNCLVDYNTFFGI